MKHHLRSATAALMLMAGASASSVRAAGLPYQMSGTLEEQARIAAAQVAYYAVYGVMDFNVASASTYGSSAVLTRVGNAYFRDTSWLTGGSTLTVTNLAVNTAQPVTAFPILITGLISNQVLTVDGISYTPGRPLRNLSTSLEAFNLNYPWSHSSSPHTTTTYAPFIARSAESSMTVTPTLSTGTAATRILVNGVEVASGAASQPIALAVGDNVIVVEVQWPSVIPAGDTTSQPIYRTFMSHRLQITRPEREVPEIVVGVYSGAANGLSPGAKQAFDRVAVGQNQGRGFYISNTGTGALTGVSVSIDGANASDFSVQQQPAATIARLTGSSQFTLRFTPTTTGKKTAVAHVWSNDADESPFHIALEGTGGTQAEFLMSLPDNKLRAGTNVFTWDTGGGATQYALWFGSTPGAADRGYGTFKSGTTSTTITSPGDGQPVYVTLWSLVNGVWQKTNSVFSDYLKTKAQITSPANGARLTSTLVSFLWHAGIGATKYALWVGTTAGGRDIYAADEGTQLARTVNVPANGRKIHVTLYSMINNAWQSNSYIFDAPSGAAATIDNSGGVSRVLPDGRLSLQFGAGMGVSKRVVWIGSAFGGHDIGVADVSDLTGNVFNAPADGGPVYVTIWSLINGAWQSSHSLFDAALPGASEPRPARLTSPANTSVLPSTNVDLTWDAGVGASQYALWIGSQPDGYDLHASVNGANLSQNVTLPGDGRRVYVTLHSLISGAWKSNSYFFNAPTTPPPVAARVTSPVAGTTLADTSLALTWDAGTNVTSYALWVGSKPSGWDLYAASEGTNRSRTITVPADGRPLYVTLHSLSKGAWLQTTEIFNAATTAGGNLKARMITPANGSALAGAETTFTWDTGVGATAYVLWVGSAPGGYDSLSTATSTDLTRTVTLPTDGRKIHVTLWSKIGAAWQANHYLYTAAKIDPVKSAMISPAAGSTFSSANVTFTWDAGIKVAQNALWIGRRPGGWDLHSSIVSSGLTQTVTNLPTDGSPVYVTLHSLINGVWQRNEYICNAALVQ